MEARVKKYWQLSPERTKVWREPSRKCQGIRKVPVVYYLCRNRQLEHPHVIDVPLSSKQGLYLRDVIGRLNELRGKGMPSMYSWSSKRCYKNGFVWHDLCEDDLILPSNGNEYVLKASEIFQEPTASAHIAPTVNANLQNQKQTMEPASTRSNNNSSSSSSLDGLERKHCLDNEFSPPVQRSTSPCESPESSCNGPDSLDKYKESCNDPHSLEEHRVFNSEIVADASTQNEETIEKKSAAQETCTRGVSTDEGPLKPEINNSSQNQVEPKDSNPSTSNGKIDTLKSLIQADVRAMNSFRILHQGVKDPSCRKIKTSNILMQLITCGSISAKDHKPQFSLTKFASPLFSRSLMLGEPDYLPENTRLEDSTTKEEIGFIGTQKETQATKGFSLT